MAKEATPRADALRELREQQAREREARNKGTGNPPAVPSPKAQPPTVETKPLLTLQDHDTAIDAEKQNVAHAFRRIAQSLEAVHIKQLWIGHTGSYEAWCLNRHGFSLRRAQQIIKGAKDTQTFEQLQASLIQADSSLQEQLNEHVYVNITTEAQARALPPLIELIEENPAAAAEVLRELTADGKQPTAPEIRQAARQKKADFNAEYNIPPVERRSKPAEAKPQAPEFDEGVASQVWDKIVAGYGPEPTIDQIRQGMERYRPMTVREGQQRTACMECGDFRDNHVTTVAGIGPCTQLKLVDRPDGTTIPERCLCARYVAPEVEEVTIGGDIVVYSTKFLGMVRALHLELNKPESKMGLAQVASNPTLAREAGEQLDALALLIRRAQAMLMEPVEA